MRFGQRRRRSAVRRGFEAVRHRAVARRAGLPLASTTYYFSSLDDLIAAAVEFIGMREAAQLRTRVAGLSKRRRGAETTAEVLVELLVDHEGLDTVAYEQLISRYERYIACAPARTARHPAQDAAAADRGRGRGRRAFWTLGAARTDFSSGVRRRWCRGVRAHRRLEFAAGDRTGHPHRRH